MGVKTTGDFSPWYSVPQDGKVQCRLCKATMAKRPARMLSHLRYSGPTGVRDTGVSLCSRLTTAVRAVFDRCEGIFPKPVGIENVDGNPVPVDLTELSTGRDMSQSGHKDSSPTLQAVVCAEPSRTFTADASDDRETSRACTSRSHKQGSLVSGFEEGHKRNLNSMWANFFYSANIPFSVARNPAFKEAVKKTAAFGRSYTPPSYHDLRYKLLKEAKTNIQTQLNARTEVSIRKFGATVSIDGWSSVTMRPLINAMLVSSAGEEFLGSVDTSGFEKTGEYLAAVLEKFIEQVGPKNVVLVTTDNAPVNPRAWDLISAKYPHIYYQGCVVHALNLLLKDWAGQKWIAENLNSGILIAKFIRKRHMPLALLRKYSPNLGLLMPGDTRFASKFIMMERLTKLRSALEQTVVDPQWAEYVRTLKKKRGAKVNPQVLATLVKEFVLDDHFWKRAINYVEMVEPVIIALRDLDSKSPCMGKVLHIMRKLEKHVYGLQSPPFCLVESKVIPLVQSFNARRKMVVNDLQSAAALLNPYLLEDEDLADDADAKSACKRVLERLCEPDEYGEVVREFMAFRHKDPPFHKMLNPKKQMLSAHAWWDFEGACGKFIAPLAKRILAQPVSSSSCERNWSSYSFVHNKSRNKLKPERAADLVYVYTNSKVINASKEKDEKKWYDDNVDTLESEDSDRPALEDNDEDDDEDLERILRAVIGGDDFSRAAAEEDEEGMQDIPDSVDDTYDNRNDRNVNVQGNANDLYAFTEDEDDVRVEENVPSLSAYCDGTGYLSSENILSEKAAANAKEVEKNENALDDGGETATVLISKLPSVALNMVEAAVGENDKGRCEIIEVDVQKHVGSNSGCKGKSNIEVQKHSGSTGMAFTNSFVVNSGKGKEPMQSISKATRSTGLPPVPLKQGSTGLEGSQSFGLGKRLMNISKEISTGGDVRKDVSSPTDLIDTDSDHITLLALRTRCFEKPREGEHNISTYKTPLLQEKMKVEITIHGQGDPKSKEVVRESSKGKIKKVMQPFATSPLKKKTPLDEDVKAYSNRKKRKVPIQKAPNGSIKVKKEKLDPKEGSKRAFKEGLRRTTIEDADDTDDADDDSDNEDFEQRAIGESSGAEVKGDKDWCP